MDDNYALFDFCGTIVNFQSFNPFIEEVLKAERKWAYEILTNRGIRFLILFVTKIINKLNKNFYLDKSILLFFTRGIQEKAFKKVADSYYQEFISKKLIKETIEVARKCQENDIKIIIISAGCDLYISKITSLFNVECIIANNIKFKYGKSMGCLDNRDLLGVRKVYAVQKMMERKNVCPRYVLGVSDSISDKPMLDLCEKRIVISHNNHQKWVSSQYEEVIYE